MVCTTDGGMTVFLVSKAIWKHWNVASSGERNPNEALFLTYFIRFWKSKRINKQYIYVLLSRCHEVLGMELDAEEYAEDLVDALAFVMGNERNMIKKSLTILSDKHDFFASSKNAHINMMKAAFWVMQNSKSDIIYRLFRYAFGVGFCPDGYS
ncbi:hypothetical protein IV203_029576 [Nitzschia inconspicua]|uniref:Uncharacterized protein n=1 Tax=Nitzschia inconspicua TaxID=303405 RepID=A0A9K3LTN8_9STRA|nr:hypothetical protein IV203_029576 [Nitzschia inconspicua]